MFTTTTAAGRSSTANLDALGRVTQEQTAGLAPSVYAYNNSGLLSSVTQGAGATSRVTTLAYDGKRELSGVTDGLARTTNLAYDAAGRLVTRTMPGNRTVQYAYDAAGNTTAITRTLWMLTALLTASTTSQRSRVPDFSAGTQIGVGRSGFR